MTSKDKRRMERKAENQSKKKKRARIIVVCVIVATALALVAGTLAVLFHNGIILDKEAYQKLAQDRKIVATCNGFEIPYEELRFVTKYYKDSLAHAYGVIPNVVPVGMSQGILVIFRDKTQFLVGNLKPVTGSDYFAVLC